MQQLIWLASFPRSGNTFLRTILWHCFGLRSASVYPSDLGGNSSLEAYVGHIEHSQNGRIQFPSESLPLIKTHERPTNDSPAIYIVRDGRHACLSLWEFYHRNTSLGDIIRGNTRFGSWSAHIESWQPWARPQTLFLKYEDILQNLPVTLQRLSAFLSRDLIADSIPPREKIAGIDGRWVRSPRKTNVLPEESLREFNALHEDMMKRLGYY